MPEFEEKITITISQEGYESSFSTTKPVLRRDDVLSWFEHQVLPALGYMSKKDE